MSENKSNQLSRNIIYKNDNYAIDMLIGHDDIITWCNREGVLTIKHPDVTYTHTTKPNEKLFAVSISKEYDIIAIGGEQNKLIFLDLYGRFITEFNTGFVIRNIKFIGNNVIVSGRHGSIIVYDFLNFNFVQFSKQNIFWL